MSWAEVKKINNNMSISLDELLLKTFPHTWYFYDTTSFIVPFDTGLTIRACGKGGTGNKNGGGSGAGYVKDYRQYKKGDIINISLNNGIMTITQSDRNLNLIANAGAEGQNSAVAGGTASGGNLINATGGTGNGGSSSLGCGGRRC